MQSRGQADHLDGTVGKGVAWVVRIPLEANGLRPLWEKSGLPKKYRGTGWVELQPFEVVDGKPVQRTWNEVRAALAIKSPKTYWFRFKGDGTGVPGVTEYTGEIPERVQSAQPPVKLNAEWVQDFRAAVSTTVALASDPVEWPKLIEKIQRGELTKEHPAFQEIAELVVKLRELFGAV